MPLPSYKAITSVLATLLIVCLSGLLGCGKAAYDQQMEKRIKSLRVTAVAEPAEDNTSGTDTTESENTTDQPKEEELSEDEREDLRLEREAEEAEEREIQQQAQLPAHGGQKRRQPVWFTLTAAHERQGHDCQKQRQEPHLLCPFQSQLNLVHRQPLQWH